MKRVILNGLIKMLGGHTKTEYAALEERHREAKERVEQLEPYREFTESIITYTGSYPAWKAQSEYREVMAELGSPIPATYTAPLPTTAELVDMYLGRVVDGLAVLATKPPLPHRTQAFGCETKWQGPGLSSARGDRYLGAVPCPACKERLAENGNGLCWICQGVEAKCKQR